MDEMVLMERLLIAEKDIRKNRDITRKIRSRLAHLPLDEYDDLKSKAMEQLESKARVRREALKEISRLGQEIENECS